MTDSYEGKMLPKLTLKVNPGDTIQIPEDLMGQWTVLYFYPKDDTPGCTKQACGYQESLAQFAEKQINVLGVSLDSVESHASFATKFSLQFPLIADVDHALSEALGVYGDQEWKGKVSQGLSRDSFLIDPNGRIAKVWRGVDPTATVNDTLLAALKISNNA